MSTPRLWVYLARESPIAVVLRRGPTKQFLLVRWDRRDDSFEAGQWLKGRVYERRCDLSPSGDRFIYFAANHRPPYGTWTAISRPPYFTALALWPKGDAWGGGGLFRTENDVLLNHAEFHMALNDGTALPKGVTVSRTAYGGGGEDNPIHTERLTRDGWQLHQKGTWGEYSRTGPMAWVCDPPEIWQKPSPVRAGLELRMATLGVKEQQGPWHVVQYVLADKGEAVHDLGRLDWADWDANGDLLFASGGALCRLRLGKRRTLAPPTEAITLIDLAPLTFKRVPPSAAAQSWRGPRPSGVTLSTR